MEATGCCMWDQARLPRFGMADVSRAEVWLWAMEDTETAVWRRRAVRWLGRTAGMIHRLTRSAR
ncbi:MAG: hypothetical protein HFH35_01985 [Eubacterium sp.]|nr:hypothetical protein [Eubacterium sp.]